MKLELFLTTPSLAGHLSNQKSPWELKQSLFTKHAQRCWKSTQINQKILSSLSSDSQAPICSRKHQLHRSVLSCFKLLKAKGQQAKANSCWQLPGTSGQLFPPLPSCDVRVKKCLEPNSPKHRMISIVSVRGSTNIQKNKMKGKNMVSQS